MAFKKGHKKFGGRQKGTPNKRTRDAEAVAQEMGVDPLRVLLTLCSHRDPSIQLGAAKEAAKYLYSQKRITELSGIDGQPIEMESSSAKELVETFKAMLHTKLNERKG